MSGIKDTKRFGHRFTNRKAVVSLLISMRGKASRLHMLHIILLWSVVGVFRYQFCLRRSRTGAIGVIVWKVTNF